MSDGKNTYLKQRYRKGIVNYILMLFVAAIFLSLGIPMFVLIFIHFDPDALLGLIVVLTLLGFGGGFGFYALKIISKKIRSARLIDNGKSGIGRFVRLKTVYYRGGMAHKKHSIIFRYANDNNEEKEIATDYIFFGDEVRKLKPGIKIAIKYNNKFAVVDDLITTFQEASDTAKKDGKEYLNYDRTLETVHPKINRFLNIAKIAIIALLIIFISLLVTSIITKIMMFLYIGAGLLCAGFFIFAIIFAVLFFGKNK